MNESFDQSPLCFLSSRILLIRVLSVLVFVGFFCHSVCLGESFYLTHAKEATQIETAYHLSNTKDCWRSDEGENV